MAQIFANSGDTDQTPHLAAFDLGLHCFPVTLLRVSRVQWINILMLFTAYNHKAYFMPFNMIFSQKKKKKTKKKKKKKKTNKKTKKKKKQQKKKTKKKQKKNKANDKFLPFPFKYHC